MTRITVTCPITWSEQCTWIRNNCLGAIDRTEWSAWNIGLDYIYFDVQDSDAIIYKLIWNR
jgi:hypothetical protein